MPTLEETIAKLTKIRDDDIHTPQAAQKKAKDMTWKEAKKKGMSFIDFITDFIPGVGEVKGAKETYDYAKEGETIPAIIAGTGTALGIVPVIGDTAAKGLRGTAKALSKSKKADEGYLDPVTMERMVPDDKGGYRPIETKDIGWNFSGKSDKEFVKDQDKYFDKTNRQKFLTDDEKSLDNQGLLGDYLDNADIATPKDIEVADLIATTLKDPSKGNYPREMVVKEILDAADHSKLSMSGLAEALSNKLNISRQEAIRLISSTK